MFVRTDAAVPSFGGNFDACDTTWQLSGSGELFSVNPQTS